MKHFNIILPLFAALFLLVSCEEQELEREMDEVYRCTNVDETSNNVQEILMSEMGVIREVDFWLPASDGPKESVSEPEKITLWVIYPEDHPEMILKPCYLPEAQLIPNNRVSFSGLVLNHYEDGLDIGGVTPFMLTEISGGEDGHNEDGC